MSKRQPREVDRIVKSPTSGVVVVVVFSLAVWMASRRHQEVLVLAVLRQWQRPDSIMEVLFVGSMWYVDPWYGAEVF
jgi:hypothetical protein